MNIAGYSDWAVVQQVLQSGAAVFIGSLLLSSAFLKARDRAGFLAAIQALDSAIVGSATGDAVIAAEAAAGLLTLIPAARDLGLWLAVAVFAAFALTFARLALRGIRYAQCGCRGPSSTERPTSVARIIWMSSSLSVISAWPAASPESSPPIALAGAAGIGLGLLALSAVYVVDALRANTAASFEWRRR